jgi:hypothetical protein
MSALTVVTAFPAGIPDNIPRNDIPSSEHVIEVNGGTRQIIDDIVSKGGEACLGLKPKRALLLPDPQLSNQVPSESRTARLVACRRIMALRITPPRCEVHTQPGRTVIQDADVTGEPLRFDQTGY